jgi:hypothetical protein
MFLIPLILCTALSEPAEETQREKPIWSLLPPSQEKTYTKTEGSKITTNGIRRTKHGKVEASYEVENTDFVSRCRAEWEKGRNGDDKEKSHSPKASFSIHWSNEK